MPKSKKRSPGKPRGMNLAQSRQYERQVFNGLVDAAAQEILIQRSGILQQQVIDAAFFAANDLFHLGPTRCRAFGELIVRYVHEIAVLVNSDAEDDPDISYAKGKLDQRMQRICGGNFDPWEVRYGRPISSAASKTEGEKQDGPESSGRVLRAE